MMRFRPYLAAPVLIAVAVAGYAGFGDNGSGTLATTTAKAASNGRGAAAPNAAAQAKTPVPPSPNLKIALSPPSGSPGTIVHITASDCVDLNGENHQVSYNVSRWRITPGRGNPVRAVGSTLSGTTLTATYTVRKADLRGHGTEGTFFVQCGSTVVSAPFTVTR